MTIEKVYVSGKISGLDLIESQKNFKNAAILVSEMKKKPINAFYIKPLFGVKKWFFYMVSDVNVLRKCDSIAMQSNWTDSKGAVIEYFLAKFVFKLKVYFL